MYKDDVEFMICFLFTLPCMYMFVSPKKKKKKNKTKQTTTTNEQNVQQILKI